MSTHEPPTGPDPETPGGPVTPPPPPAYGSSSYPPPPGDASGGYPPPPGGPSGYGGGYPPPPPPPGGPGFVEPFSATDAIGYGWRKFSAAFGPWLVLGLIAFALIAVFFIVMLFTSIGFSFATTDLESFGSLLTFFVLGFALTLALSILNAVGIRGALDATEGRAFDLGDALRRIDIAKVIVLSVLLSLIGNLGSLVPGLLGAIVSLVGFVITFLTYFAMTFVVDRGISPIESLLASVDLIKSNLGDSILLALLAFVVLVIGMCPCGLLLFIAYPVVTIATAYAYRRFQDQPVVA